MIEIPCPHGQGWMHLLFDIALFGPVVFLTVLHTTKAFFLGAWTKIKLF